MNLTRHHFELIASVIWTERRASMALHAQSATQRAARLAALDALAHRFSLELHAACPNFDRAHFLTACGVKGDAK